MQRVKVYRLNAEGLWDDKGTGSVSVEFLEVRGNTPGSRGRHAFFAGWRPGAARPPARCACRTHAAMLWAAMGAWSGGAWRA